MTDVDVATPSTPHRDRAPRRAQMSRYALWQMRDYVLERGLATIALAATFAIPNIIVMHAMMRRFAEGAETVRPSAVIRYGSLAAAQQAQFREMSLGFIRGSIGIIVFLGALLAVQGLASNDRKNGYFRFLFAKPVSPERYYGQAFLVHWVGFLLVVVLLLLLWGWFAVPVISVHLLLAAALLWVCYAGIGFLCTALMRWDWLLLSVVATASSVLWARFEESTSVLAKLLWLLPPLTKIDSVYAAATSPQPAAMPWGTIAWLAGYGIICYVAGLVVLHHRRLATP